MHQIIDPTVAFHDGQTYGKQLVIEHKQEIPQSFLDELAEARKASTERPMGDFHRVASIPVGVYEAWLRSGYDARKEPISKTIAKLKAESLDYFLTTEKRI